MPARPPFRFGAAVLLPLLVLVGACAPRQGTTAPASHLDEVRIAAIQTEAGFGFERARARQLFFEALGHAEAGDCREAAYLFDRLVEHFPGSRYMPPALYDAAVCLARIGEDTRAAARFERLVRQVPSSPGTPRARLELASAYARLQRWDRAERQLDAVLALGDLGPSVRLEALVQRARLFLSMGELPTSERLAREAIAYAPVGLAGTEQAALELLRAEATFLHAETYRMRASAVTLARADERPRRERIGERAALMLEAQRLYFETLRRGQAGWSEQAGLRLAALYRDLWSELPAAVRMPSTVASAEPASVADPGARLSSDVEGLIRRGLRQAELALRQLEELHQVPSGFAAQVRSELEAARTSLGPGNLGPPDGTRPAQDL